MSFEPIAIVGRACVLPGALTPAALWQNVCAGRDLIGPAPPGRWRIGPEILATPGPAADRTWSDRGGYVEGFETAFEVNELPEAARHFASLDPLFQWLLYVSAHALREAGLEGGPRAGAVFGNLSLPSPSMARYAERVWLGEELAAAANVAPADPRDRFMSGLPAHLVAQALGLGAGAWAIDAACASSLYAIKLACDRLQDRSADVMIAGGVNRADDLFLHVGFCALQAMSRTGRSRPFHRQADGLVPAEGAGAVVLRRLVDAESSGERVLGVIRAVGLSNDGRGRNLLAPSEDGPARAMRAAYQASGLRPEDISLVECHATGTPIGDAAELRSMRRVFEGARDVPIGSLKSNLGHTITAAGVAGLIKVLGALEAGSRPPTLHTEEPIAEIGAPFRVLREVEPWTAPMRRAAVSAFGFGGNNAHLLVEEHQPGAKWRGVPVAVGGEPGDEIAIVGIGAAVGAGRTVAELEEALFAAGPDCRARAEEVLISAKESRFPPRDLSLALAQQTALLMATEEARGSVSGFEGARVGVLVGMGCDPEVARYGARWRVRGWADAWGIQDASWLTRSANAFAPPLEAAGVLGALPNLPANRLNFQYGLGGPSFTVSAEELSGVRALELAIRSLRAEELDLLLVGAADFSCEAVHQAALRQLGDPRPAGDAAVVLMLKRARQARRDGDEILALVEVDAPGAAASGRGSAAELELGVEELAARFGTAHAAFGLVCVAAGALACARGRHWGGAPWSGERSARLELSALGGARQTVRLRSVGTAVIAPRPPSPDAGARAAYPAHLPPVVLPLLADVVDEVAEPVGLGSPLPPESQTMPPPPRLPPVDEVDEAAPEPARGSRRGAAAALAALQHQRLAQIHQQFVAGQAAAQQRFLVLREQSQRWLLEMTRAGPPRPSPATAASGSAPAGLRLEREGLEVHAGGLVSSVFGPLFLKQDALRRQVRMPEPPLLLADRLLGLEAEPASMGKGRLWTETEVRADSWYLHHGRMPAGIMVEAGQADLMLISYLGIDLVKRGDRVYRLLGCELSFCRSLPRPGETLRYRIEADGHAQQGEVRLFFFHYDCSIAGEPMLRVRDGQAGFFTDEELAGSAGVLWEAASAERCADPRLDPPCRLTERRRWGRGQLEAWAAGRANECFGRGFEAAAAHTRTPGIPSGRLLLLDEVTELSPEGGPWGRGYLRARDRVEPEDWFFQGHFKNDPCMPGTLMLEACLEAMAVYLAGLGFTLLRDGWRFEPVPDEAYRMRCRGQVTPSSRELVYEVFVEELWADPLPTLWADVLCTVDGLKAFHCRRLGLRLVPDWPLESRPELLAGLQDRRPVASAAGFSFGARSLLACAWGRPSDAFGPVYGAFDGPRRVPRLPGPPYLLMSRVTRVQGELGAMQGGSTIEAECDLSAAAPCLEANGFPTLPYCALLEIALQPCGWLASYVGSALQTDRDLAFRNLDGTATVLGEVRPGVQLIRTQARLTSLSRSGGVLIESFEVTCLADDQPVYRLATVFGFFPAEALADQRGLPASDAERRALAAPSPETIDLRQQPERWFGSGPRLAAPFLLMIDRVTGVWPSGGPAGLGQFRAEAEVDPSAWFFKAHFFQDPVQPGSLGLEAMLQLLQFAMIRLGLADAAWARGRFEPFALGAPHSWKYRGQILPHHRRVVTLLDITKIEEDARGRVAFADASLWVDGTRIYQAQGIAMRIVPPDAGAEDALEEVLDPEQQRWILEHRPTWTVPALPLMSMVDRLAGAALRRAPHRRVVGVQEARAHRWVPLPGPVRLRVETRPSGADAVEATLLVWRDAPRSELSRFEPVCSARILLADEYPSPAAPPWPPLVDASPAPSPYDAGTLFHGPSFQLLRGLRRGPGGASTVLDAGAGTVPPGTLHQALLDALTHGIPHDDLSVWSADIPPDQVAYPHRVASLRLYGELPREGRLRCETRFAGFDGEERFPKFRIQASTADRVLVDLELVEVLFPRGPIGAAPPLARRAFLRDQDYVPGVRLSRQDGEVTRLATAAVQASDWLPGTVARAYAAGADLVAEVAAKEHLAARLGVHPATVRPALDRGELRCDREPLTVSRITLERSADGVAVRPAGPSGLDLSPVRAFWERYFGIGRWPVEDLYYGLAACFVRRVVLEDPRRFAAVRGRGLLYLANHQVGIESLLFSVLIPGLSGLPNVTLAKAEHRGTWLGRLIQHAFTYPGARDPGVITYFDRTDRGELPRIIEDLAGELRRGQKSVMVHVEGTRSLSCRVPVVKMSGAFLDMAIATETPVVPLRFTGGLPVEPAEERLEFPVGMGQQDILLGRPILPQELAALHYKERKERVIEAINALGPPAEEEEPLPGDPGLASAAVAWARKSGASPEHSVLLEVLRRLGDPGEEVQELLQAVKSGTLRLPGDGRGRWLAELARRCFGERGPAVELEKG